GRADHRQQSARRPRGALQRSLHRPAEPGPQQRQRAVDRCADRRLRARRRDPCPVARDPVRWRPARETDRADRRDRGRGAAPTMTTPQSPLRATDPQIADIIDREGERQNTTIQLIASENFTSTAVLEAQGSVLTNKYSEGYPAKRYYGGNAVVDEAEELARNRACELFGAEHANVQPHSGANANQAAFMAVLQPGDRVMGMRLDQGGHL